MGSICQLALDWEGPFEDDSTNNLPEKFINWVEIIRRCIHTCPRSLPQRSNSVYSLNNLANRIWMNFAEFSRGRSQHSVWLTSKQKNSLELKDPMKCLSLKMRFGDDFAFVCDLQSTNKRRPTQCLWSKMKSNCENDESGLVTLYVCYLSFLNSIICPLTRVDLFLGLDLFPEDFQNMQILRL